MNLDQHSYILSTYLSRLTLADLRAILVAAEHRQATQLNQQTREQLQREMEMRQAVRAAVEGMTAHDLELIETTVRRAMEQPAAPAVELTKLEAALLRNHTYKRPCAVEDWPDAHTVWLRVGVQSFCVTPHCCETADDAEWTRAMLAKALANLVLLTHNAPHEGPGAASSRTVPLDAVVGPQTKRSEP